MLFSLLCIASGTEMNLPFAMHIKLVISFNKDNCQKKIALNHRTQQRKRVCLQYSILLDDARAFQMTHDRRINQDMILICRSYISTIWGAISKCNCVRLSLKSHIRC